MLAHGPFSGLNSADFGRIGGRSHEPRTPPASKPRKPFNSYTTITDRTPELLSTMDSLERVTFDTCHGLTNAGIARLARLPKLRELRVSGRAVTVDVRRAFGPGVEVFCGA
jgi:hypothetical protein